ncbi:MAG: hypothetical protein H5U00_05065 [Clostridia bacterium]|nr:hypothetical protein [Clostridia bacterium]
MPDPNLKEAASLIQNLRAAAIRLRELTEIPAVVRNAERILASVRMLELNVNEALAVLEGEESLARVG